MKPFCTPKKDNGTGRFAISPARYKWIRGDARPDACSAFLMSVESQAMFRMLVGDEVADCDKCKNKITCLVDAKSDVTFEPSENSSSTKT